MRDFQLPGRSAVYADNAMAATAHPSATLAAVEVMKCGGNAVDAAIAAAGVLAVVEPGMSGIGGDCFAMLAQGDQPVAAYNGSGPAGQAASADRLLALGIDEIHPDSAHSVTIPGAVDAWQALLDKYGTRSFDELLAPAIAFAEEGYRVQSRVAMEWTLGVDKLNGNSFSRKLFLKNGQPLQAGDTHRQPGLAKALRAISSQGAAGFYAGPVAEDIVQTLRNADGLQTLDDFSVLRGSWVNPVLSDYRNYQVTERPPNGQGFLVSLILNILSQFSADELEPNSAEALHLQIEAARLASTDRDRFFDEYYTTDKADKMLQDFLSAEYADSQAKKINLTKAMPATRAKNAPQGGDTTYIAVVDRDGIAISLMNSLYYPFGSGLASEKYGILLNNRGSAFALRGPAPRIIAPGKRPVHTIIPAMLMQSGQPVMVFGVVGAEHQPGGQVRLVSAIVDAGLDVQQALDLPRAFYDQGTVLIERGISDRIRQTLHAFGHRTAVAETPLGAGQAIWIDHQRSCLIGGSDYRKGGCALGF
jgi:gamma-glutamyltranspeptidase/glutathione hydrolase